MILTVCLSSTLQKTVTFNKVSLTHVNRSTSYRLDASGKAVNTARVLDMLEPGVSLSLCPLGKENADLFLKLAEQDKLAVKTVMVPGFTRECLTLLDSTNHETTEIVVGEPALDFDREKAEQEFMEILQKALSEGTDPKSKQKGTDPYGKEGTDPYGKKGTDPQSKQEGTDPQLKQEGTDPYDKKGTKQEGTDPYGKEGTDPQSKQEGTDPQLEQEGTDPYDKKGTKQEGTDPKSKQEGTDPQLKQEGTDPKSKQKGPDPYGKKGTDPQVDKAVQAVVLAGSRPAMWSEDFQARISNVVVDAGVILLADFCGKDLLRTLELCTPQIIKINEEEFCSTFGYEFPLPEDKLRLLISEKSKELKNVIVITRGTEETYAARNGVFYSHPVEKVVPVNTTACGDTFNAGFIYEYLKTMDETGKADVQSALSKGTWCAARNAESEVPGTIR